VSAQVIRFNRADAHGRHSTVALALVVTAMVGFLLIPASSGAATQASPTYTVSLLKNPPGASPDSIPTAVAISDDDDVVGTAEFVPKAKGSSPRYDAVIWHDGVPTDIATELKGGQPMGINATGEIVGNCPDDACAFVFKNGKYTALDGLAQAYGLNNAGEVVGYNVTGPWTYAATWTGGLVTRMVHATASGWGVAVNSAGDVAGANPQAAGSGTANQPALWRGGKYRNLESAGGCYGQSSGINGSDQVVGFTGADGSCSYDTPAAFVWKSDKFTDLNPLTGQLYSSANAINDAGTIVGDAFGDSNVPTAWIYSHGTLTYLRSLISPHSKWFLQDPVAINSAGQIIGWGQFGKKTETFLMTPR
jgi:uncharacterized membrane protein